MKALLPLSLLGNLFACIFALAYFNTMPPEFWWRGPAISVTRVMSVAIAVMLVLSCTVD